MLGIKLYWLIPPAKRRRCLFKKSCSHHIFEVTHKQGFVKGIYALKKRIAQCRPGYKIYVAPDNYEWIILSDGSLVDKNELDLERLKI